MGGKGKDRKKKSTQSARQAAQRRAVQQRTAERRVRDLRFRLLSARDASAAAGRLMDTFTDRDRVSCAYDAEATVSSVAGLMPQAGFAGDRLRDACLDICDALAASSAPLAVGILRAFAVAGPDSAVRDHARILADAAGRTAPAWAAELGQAIPGKCWVTTDPFRESTVLLCEFSYPTRGNRHAVITRLDPVWHYAVSSLAAPFLEEESSLDAGSAMGLARRLGADLREVPSAEAAGLLRAGLDAFAQHGPAPWTKRDSEDYRTTLGLAVLAGQRARELAAAAGSAGRVAEAPSGTTADRWPPEERERLVAQFHRSPESRALTGVVARFLPRDLVAFCADYLGRDPLRPGPLLFRRLLRDVLPMQLVVPARLAGDVAPVIRAWAAWTADRANLPERLRRRLLSELDGELRKFPAVLAAASQKPHNRYFQDLPDDVISDDTRCLQALQRRHLAVPLYHDRAEGTATLDAAEPSGRAKITELWLAGRGIPPDERASYQAVVEELWAGEPPQVAGQALRMAADGLSRDAVLDKLVQDR
ncbi:MAG TPA: hypothetical protein VF951_18100 [Streptosporangiaceae bacterium]